MNHNQQQDCSRNTKNERTFKRYTDKVSQIIQALKNWSTCKAGNDIYKDRRTFVGDDKNKRQVRRRPLEDITEPIAAEGPLAIITALPEPISAAREHGGGWMERQVGRLEQI